MELFNFNFLILLAYKMAKNIILKLVLFKDYFAIDSITSDQTYLLSFYHLIHIETQLISKLVPFRIVVFFYLTIEGLFKAVICLNL